MTKFYDTTPTVFGGLTAQQLDAIARDRAGVVRSIGFGYALADEPGELPGGWTARWVNTRGMGNHGTLILVPTDARTRKIAREGKIRAFKDAGLSRMQAERLYRADARYKSELVVILADILDDPAQVRAMLAHPGTYGFGSGRAAWLRAWGDVFGPEGLGLSAPREAALAQMVRAVV